MFWYLVLPVKITFWFLVGLVLVVTVLSPLVRLKRTRAIAWSLGIAFLGFVPSCSLITAALDANRFGVFNYPDFQSVNDSRVEQYLPPAARNILVDKYVSGFDARFGITPAELEAFMDDCWEKYGKHSTLERVKPGPEPKLDPETFKLWFGHLNWPAPKDAVKYNGPRAPNGAGFDLWYSVTDGVAFQRAGYW